MTLLLGSLQLGLIYGLLAIGIFIGFRIMNIPDLTAEGSFTFGLVVSAVLTAQGHAVIALPAALLAGALAGLVTGLLHTKLTIPAILAGILTMSGLYSVNLLVMGNKSNYSLIGADTIFRLAQGSELAKTLIAFSIVAMVALFLHWFFQTRIGLSIRATGDNEAMCMASSINVEATKILSFCIANACIALSGGLLAQYQQFADVNSGVGILVVGLASVIIGEAFIRRGGLLAGFIAAVVGSVVYRFIVALAYQSELFPASSFRLISAIIVAIALAVPALQKARAFRRSVKENRSRA